MNIGTASYGTGAFRAIASLSESAIVGLYGTADLQPEKKLMFAILLDAVECFQDILNKIVSLKTRKSGFLRTIMNGPILSSIFAKPWK